jgi:S-DNA-T family DNA segregation ATPase FtsK/SpoIIIE
MFRKPKPRRGRRRAPSRRSTRRAFRVPRLDQRQRDVVGLAVVAVGVYLGLVLYAGWDGGPAGQGARDALEFSVGRLAHAVPFAAVLSGAALVLQPFLPPMRPVRAGSICIGAGLLLAFAAASAGLGPDTPARHDYFDASFMKEHGGLLGEVLYWSATTLFQRAGAHILAGLLVLSGMLLVSGLTIASVLRAGGRWLRDTGELARTVQRPGSPAPLEAQTFADETERIYGGPELVLSDDPDDDGIEEPGTLGDEPSEHPTARSYDEDVEGSPRAGDDEEPTPPEVEGAEIEVERTPMGEARGVTASEEVHYEPPSPELLEQGGTDPGPDTRNHEAVARTLLETLAAFGVEAKLLGTVTGPHVSRYELKLAPGTKVAKVAQLQDDLAYALASTEIRVLAPIPGKQAVGVEVPNQRRRIVRLGDIYQGRPSGSSPLVGWLGKDIAGNAIWTDLAKMPHVLVAGTTGSGKSGCVNAILSSILLHASPNDVRLVLVDPKRVELNHYESIPHLLTPVVTAPRLAANVLQNLIGEMENRYGVMGEARARNLVELNRTRRRAGEPPLPHVLCVIDELADLMMVAPAEVEDSIIRLAQKSRAVGIHLVLATQRPSTDIITGTIKVNIPARIAFAVSSQVDSRVILDQGGAEALLGQGDMLFRPAGTSRLQRIQGAFVTEEEIARICSHWGRQGEPEFEQELLEAREPEPPEGEEGDLSPDQDDLLEEAIHLVVQTQTASVSMLQRRLRVGYTRAGRLIDMLERRGVISGYEGSKPRQVLVTEADLPRILAGDGDAGPPAEAVSAAEEG